jgi:CubicO group peptidase (beta-lactamase class C family)
MTTLADAVAFAQAHETPWPRDLRAHLDSGHFEPPPHNAVIGPIFPRGAPNGLILHRGQRVASWGDTRQADMTFSVAKSYLSLLAGIAWGDGLLTDLDEPVREKIRDGGFESDQNNPITWRHLLTLTSEWEGELFGKADSIDRGRPLGREAMGGNDPKRRLHRPGSYFEYNDVRVNRLSLCLLRLFRRPLPEVFAERIMDPIGASRDWTWYAYDNAIVEVDGMRLPSVPGGSHWGGGVRIHAEDQALVGQLVLNRGEWNGRRIVPAEWIEWSTSPSPTNPTYGFLWWLNATGRFPAAPRDSVFAFGAGGNYTWISPETEVVGVLRWVDGEVLGRFCGMVAEAVRG